MRDSNGISRGSGFVAFLALEDASRALGEMIGRKPLYVAVAQRKEDRRARLQAQFSQMSPIAILANAAPQMPMYPPGAPGLGKQLFYGQAPPAFFPPQILSTETADADDYETFKCIYNGRHSRIKGHK